MSVGPWQIVLILFLILVLFGAGKLPHVMKDLAKGIQAFKKGLREEEDETSKPSKEDETPKSLPAEEKASSSSQQGKEAAGKGSSNSKES